MDITLDKWRIMHLLSVSFKKGIYYTRIRRYVHGMIDMLTRSYLLGVNFY